MLPPLPPPLLPPLLLPLLLLPLPLLLFCNLLLPLLLSGRSRGSDEAMLSHRLANPLSCYTKFQLTLLPSLPPEEAYERMVARLTALLLSDSLLNIDPLTKLYSRHPLSSILHPLPSPQSPPPPFSAVPFEALDPSFPVHVFASPGERALFLFVDHSVADGLAMYNSVAAPILGNPRFELARAPVYVPLATELHQVYVAARLAALYLSAKARAALGGEGPLLRLPKRSQYAAFHELPLAAVKAVKNEAGAPVAAVIMAALVRHLARSLSKSRGGKRRFRVCLSYAFESAGSFNNYSFVIVDVDASRPLREMALAIAGELGRRRHEINTMYYLLRLPSGGAEGVQRLVQEAVCDA
ncbi:hypothetical protein TeGR_g14579, partial [Tetraparma gracilis]